MGGGVVAYDGGRFREAFYGGVRKASEELEELLEVLLADDVSFRVMMHVGMAVRQVYHTCTIITRESMPDEVKRQALESLRKAVAATVLAYKEVHVPRTDPSEVKVAGSPGDLETDGEQLEEFINHW